MEDVAEIIDILVESYNSSKPLILSHGQEVPIKAAVDAIVNHATFTGEVIWETHQPNGQYRKPSDVSALMEVIGDYKFTPLDEGIKKTIDFYENNYPNVRR